MYVDIDSVLRLLWSLLSYAKHRAGMRTQLKSKGTLVDAAEMVKCVHWVISSNYG